MTKRYKPFPGTGRTIRHQDLPKYKHMLQLLISIQQKTANISFSYSEAPKFVKNKFQRDHSEIRQISKYSILENHALITYIQNKNYHKLNATNNKLYC